MVRVLLIHQPTDDFESRAIFASLSNLRSPGAQVQCVMLPPSGATPQAISRIAGLQRSIGFDVIHAVGPSSLVAALPIGCQPIIYSPPAVDALRGSARLRMISRFRQVTVAAASNAVARKLIFAGIDPSTIRVLAPPYDAQTTGTISRASLGFRDDDRILLAIDECTRAAGHKLTAWAAVILFCFDARYKLLFAGGPYGETIRRFCDGLNQRGFCVFADDALGYVPPPQELVPLANLAVFTPAGARGLLAARVCQAGNLPIAAAPHSILRELDGTKPVLVSESKRARFIAQTIHQYFETRPGTGALRGTPVHQSINSVEDWLALYDDAIVGRRVHFDRVAMARQS